MINKIEHTTGDIVGCTINFRKKTVKFDKPFYNFKGFFGSCFLHDLFSSWISWIFFFGKKIIFPIAGLYVICLIGTISFGWQAPINLYSDILQFFIYRIFFFIPFPFMFLQKFGPWKAKFNRILVESTGAGKKNKALFTDFKSKEFILPNFKNFYLEFQASKDVSKQLVKIRIKSEKNIYSTTNCKITECNTRDNEYVWNAHFYFAKIPKDGFLRLKWI